MSPYFPHLLVFFVVVWHVFVYQVSSQLATSVERLAAVEPGPEDTAILFRRNEEGREFRRRAAAGTLTPRDVGRVPECFRDLLKHLAPPVSKATARMGIEYA